MSESSFSGTLYVLSLFVISAFVLIVLDIFGGIIARLKYSPENDALEKEKYRNRLENPDWEFYEKYLERPVPEILKTIYEDKDKLQKNYSYADHHWFSFEPIDSISQSEVEGSDASLSFGYSDGDLFFLRPGAEKSNTVYIGYHEAEEVEEFCSSIDIFIAKLKENA